MSRPQDPHKTVLPFGNPFRMIFPKGSNLSPKLLDLLNNFEESLAGKLKKLKPADKEDVLRLSWMRSAMESLCEIHADIKVLITALELPICNWDDKWFDVYLDNSVKLLDICIAFSSEISRLKQGNLYLQCILHNLATASSNQFVRAQSSMDGWRQHIGSKNSRLENCCFYVMDGFAQTLHLPKIKNSSKGKVLMQAIYGVKVVTLFISSVFAAALSGSSDKLMDLQVPETCLWSYAFDDLQNFVNSDIRIMYKSGKFTALKELEVVNMAVEKLYPVVQHGVHRVEAELLQKSRSELEKSAENLSNGLDLLSKVVDGFFQIVLTGRDALLCNLRIGNDANVTNQARFRNNQEGQLVR